MDFGVQILVAFGITCSIGMPIAFYMYKKYRKQGKSTQYLSSKVAIIVGLPIISIPFLLSDKLSLFNKLIAIILMLISGIAYAYTINASRKIFRKVIGLPKENEHTGEVIKEEKNKDDYKE